MSTLSDYSNNLDLLKADDSLSFTHYETKMAAPTEVIDDETFIHVYLGPDLVIQVQGQRSL